jgi:carbon storage regulator
MLVLTRKIGERVVLPTYGITVEVVSVKGNTVRLGFIAPRHVPIHRSELWERCQEEEAKEEACVKQ